MRRWARLAKRLYLPPRCSSMPVVPRPGGWLPSLQCGLESGCYGHPSIPYLVCVPPEMPKSCIYCCRIHSSLSPHRGSIFDRVFADIFWPYYPFFNGGPLAEASPRKMASAHNRRLRPIFSSVLIVCAVLLLLFGLRAGLCVSCRSTSSMTQAEM